MKAKLKSAVRKLYWDLPADKRFRLSQATYRFRDSSTKPLVTVVVPLYNEERFVAETIASVKAQTYRHLECIVVNDCSTDASRDIAARAIEGDDRFRIVDREQNGGLSAARNTGLKHATGELITFLDADDCLLPNSLWNRVLTFLRDQRDDVAGVFCRIVQTPESGQSPKIAHEAKRLRVDKPADFISCNGECPFNVHAVLLRTELVRKFQGFDEAMKHGAEDWDLWLRMMRHGYSFISSGDLGAIYRRKAGSMVRAMPAEHVKEGMRLMNKAFTRLPESQVLPGTPFVFTESVWHYRKKIAEAKRVIQYATLCYLAGDELSFQETVNRLEAKSGFYIRRFVRVEQVVDQAFVRFHCLDDSATSSIASRYGKDRRAVLEAIDSRLGDAPVTSNYVALEESRVIPATADSLRSFKDKHKGQRCFIVGNGPSLNQTDLTKLRDEVTFGVNGIFYKTDETGFVPTYYVVEDSFVLKDNLERIRTYDVHHRFFPTLYKPMVGDMPNTDFFIMNRGFYEKRSPNFRIPRFSADITDRVYCGQSVTYINLQLAYYMGFTEVYLIGVDFSYVIPKSAKVDGLNIESTEDDPNHFHPEYFGKGKKWHDPQLDQVKKCYEFADKVFKWDGRQVFNATKGGELEVFQRVDYDSLFAARPALRVTAVG